MTILAALAPPLLPVPPPRHIRHPRALLEALGHDPGIHLSWPTPIATCRLRDLDAAITPIPVIRQRHSFLNAQNQTGRPASLGKPP